MLDNSIKKILFFLSKTDNPNSRKPGQTIFVIIVSTVAHISLVIWFSLVLNKLISSDISIKINKTLVMFILVTNN